MITVTVKLYATLRRYHPEAQAPAGQPITLQVDDGTTVGQLIERLGVPRHEVKVAFVRGVVVADSLRLRDGDDVGVFPPVAGGALVRIGLGGVLTIGALALALAGPAVTSAPVGAASPSRLILATTTSMADSGLLPLLLLPFARQAKVRVDVVAVGTGQALALARRGDADVVLVHAPSLEEEFLAAGDGIRRTCVAYNTFVIAGPPHDPAQVSTARGATEAFARIAGARAPFVSRGDGSGTEAKEHEAWRRGGLSPRGQFWYLVSGGGMGMTLTMADEKQAYTLTDLATFLTMQPRLNLRLLYEGDPALINQYAAIATNPARHPRVNARVAMALIDYLISTPVQQQIFAFGREQFGRPLFIPLRGRCLR